MLLGITVLTVTRHIIDACAGCRAVKKFELLARRAMPVLQVLYILLVELTDLLNTCRSVVLAA